MSESDAFQWAMFCHLGAFAHFIGIPFAGLIAPIVLAVTMTVAAGGSSEQVYGWIFHEGTTQGEGQGAGVQGQVGVGPDGDIPEGSAEWVWTDAGYYGDKDGLSEGDQANDEYLGSFTAPSDAGSYDYAYRFSVDGGGTWTYCDAGGDEGGECEGAGSDDGYSSDDAGQLTVE